MLSVIKRFIWVILTRGQLSLRATVPYDFLVHITQLRYCLLDVFVNLREAIEWSEGLGGRRWSRPLAGDARLPGSSPIMARQVMMPTPTHAKSITYANADTDNATSFPPTDSQSWNVRHLTPRSNGCLRLRKSISTSVFLIFSGFIFRFIIYGRSQSFVNWLPVFQQLLTILIGFMRQNAKLLATKLSIISQFVAWALIRLTLISSQSYRSNHVKVVYVFE